MEPSTASALIAGFKALYDIGKANKNPEMIEKLMEIQGKAFELVNENQALKEEAVKLKASLAAKEEVEQRDDGAFWRKGEAPSNSNTGYCPNCYPSGKLLKLSAGQGFNYRFCNACKFTLNGRWTK